MEHLAKMDNSNLYFLLEMRKLLSSSQQWNKHSSNNWKNLPVHLVDLSSDNQEVQCYRQINQIIVKMFTNNELDLKCVLRNLDDYIYKTCPHKWETDIIDINPELSQKIKYCKHCSLNHKDSKS